MTVNELFEVCRIAILDGDGSLPVVIHKVDINSGEEFIQDISELYLGDGFVAEIR